MKKLWLSDKKFENPKMVFDAAVWLLGELRHGSDGEKDPEEKYIGEECKKNFCSDEADT